MKRAIAFVLVAIFLVSAMTFSASAEEKTAYDTILEGMLNCEESISILQYGLTVEEMAVLMEKVLKNEPRLFYADGSYYYMTSYISGLVSAIMPIYQYTGTELDAVLDFYDSEVESIIDTIPDSLDIYQTVIYLHDYLCVNYQYDLDLEIYDAYNMLVEGKGVCMSYALLYDELLSRIGIESRAIVSPNESLNHMWNEICINGVWYEVDVTWDDPVYDRYGKASHSNLLLSDAEMYVTHNGVYNLDYPCVSDEFDNIEWSFYDSPFGFVDGQTYLLDFNEIYSVDIYTGELELIFNAGERYWYDDNDNYIGCGIGFGSYGDWLYYNDRTSIRRYSPISRVDEVYYTPDASKGKLGGMYVSGNVIHYLAATDGSIDNGVDYTYVIADEEPVEPHVCVGAGDWQSNVENHWKLCSCGEKTDVDSHDEGYWVTTKEAEIGIAGEETLKCTVCDYAIDTRATDPLPVPHVCVGEGDWQSDAENHWKLCSCGENTDVDSHDEGYWVTTKEAEIGIAGEETLKCTVCDYAIDTRATDPLPVPHVCVGAGDWQSDAENHWKLCSCGEKTDVDSHDEGYWVTTKEAEIGIAGEETLKCTVCDYVIDTRATDPLPVPHVCVGEGDWQSDAESHWKLCSCGEKTDVDSHDEGYWVTVLEPEIGKEGLEECYCTVCDHLLEIYDTPALYLLGDVNNDGKIDSLDYLMVKRACFGSYLLSEDERVRANVDDDDDVDSLDYVMIKRIAFGTYTIEVK